MKREPIDTDSVLQDAVWAMYQVIHLRTVIWCDIYDAKKEARSVQRALAKDDAVIRARAFLARMRQQA